MKLVNTACPGCGAKLNVDTDSQKATCEFCGASLLIDDEVQHVQYDNAEEAGYNFEKGRQRAQSEAYRQNSMNYQQAAQPQKKRKTWLWVLGWIFIFPIPLTILMLRNKKLKKGIKIGIIVAAWIFYLVIGLSGGKDKNTDINSNNSSTESSSVQTTDDKKENTDTSGSNNPADSTESLESIAVNIVDGFNKVSKSKLTFKENFTVQDENSGHYRIEFRLGAYKNSLGKSYLMDDLKVDLIISPTIVSGNSIRFYADDATLEQCINLIKNTSALIDPSIEDATINEAIDYVKEHKEANGYYYGDLGLVLLGNDKDGYDIMIKND